MCSSFPSLTDTFGLAMIEALAAGVAVAALPVPGSEDVIEPGSPACGEPAWERRSGALRLNRHVCAAGVGTFSREAATSQFLAGLAPIPLPLRARVAVSRSSAMIERRAARRHTTSQAGDAN
jgi:glycosyltransferase involved in cell wall biosynthesis